MEASFYGKAGRMIGFFMKLTMYIVVSTRVSECNI